MIHWIMSNLSTIIVLFILLVIVGAIVKNLKKTKKSCGCGCDGCPMSKNCHKL